MKNTMISKLLGTIENLSSNKNYNNCNTTTTNNGCNNDSEIPRSKNTHLAPPQWDILSTTSDTTTNSDNGRSTNVIPSILTEEQLREVRFQNNAQLKEYQRLHSEKKTVEEKPDNYPPDTCVLIGYSILNGAIEKNLSNDQSVKVRKFPGATVDDLWHHALPIIRDQPKSLITHARTNDAVKFTSRDIFRIITTVFILTMSLFYKIIKQN